MDKIENKSKSIRIVGFIRIYFVVKEMCWIRNVEMFQFEHPKGYKPEYFSGGHVEKKIEWI